MTDLTRQVLIALRTAGLDPQYAYPQAWNKQPVTAFYESGNYETERADDAELASTIEFTIDIWANTPEATHEAGRTANTAMQGLGFVRTGCVDLYEAEIGTAMHHRSMTFQINNVTEG